MYLPKSKITPNLYSSGELVLASTLKPYFGNYFSTVEGYFYTGKEPNDGDNQRLIQAPNDNNEDIFVPGVEDLRFTPENTVYSVITSQPSLVNTAYPIPFTPQPTEGDYKTGEITRFFAKKHNENIYYEVQDSRVSSNPMYFVFNLQWVISGEESYVKTTNQKMVELYMRQLPIPAFNKFLKNDYLKFWKPS